MRHFRSLPVPARMATALVLVLVTALGVGGCGSSGGAPSSAAPKTASTTAPVLDVNDPFCAAAKAYNTATSRLDVGNVRVALAGMDRAVVAARALAHAAPGAVADAARRLATAATELVAAIRRRAPRTAKELETAGVAVTATLKAKYGDLDQETNVIKAYAGARCGLTTG